MHIYASCGVWKFDPCKGWGFAFDKEKGGRVLAVEWTDSFEDLRTTAFEDFGIDQNDVELELTYLPMELINTIDCPPVIIENDRQVKNFLIYVRGKASSRLCVSISHVNANNDNIELDKEQSNAPGRERVGRAPSSLTDFMFTTSNWRTAYEETINPIGVPEESWVVPDTVRNASVLAPESRRGAGGRRKRRYETVEDKLRSSQGAQEKKRRRCSRCGEENHNRATCDRAI
uniref:Uncharacterized protein n=1 Tax=Brassica oleracea TaxID=3712 RepID=A0A3P6BE03_BRAOL|nr:unnamed protein product [Brassica oleracea]